MVETDFHKKVYINIRVRKWQHSSFSLNYSFKIIHPGKTQDFSHAHFPPQSSFSHCRKEVEGGQISFLVLLSATERERESRQREVSSKQVTGFNVSAWTTEPLWHQLSVSTVTEKHVDAENYVIRSHRVGLHTLLLLIRAGFRFIRNVHRFSWPTDKPATR